MNTRQLTSLPLFAGIEAPDAVLLLGCLGAMTRLCRTCEIFVTERDSVVTVVAGKAALPDGRIVQHGVTAFVQAHSAILLAQGAEYIVLDTARITRFCQNACPAHARLCSNALALSLSASGAVRCGGGDEQQLRRCIAAALLVFCGSARSFKMPFSRKQLALCFGFDSASLSRELEKMRRDKLIAYNNRDFTLRDRMELRRVLPGAG